MTSSIGFARLATVAFVSALALGTACGSSDTGGGGQSDGSQSTAAPASTTTAPAAPTTIPLLTAPTAPPTTSANPNKITIEGFAYSGLEAAQANVTWSITNRDGVAHTVSADDKSFVWRVEPGQTTAFKIGRASCRERG